MTVMASRPAIEVLESHGHTTAARGPFKNHESVFAALAAMVEAPGYRFLQAYKKDLYEYDRAYLEANWTPRGRYLWVVRPSGTELVRLGVHDKLAEHARAAINNAMRDSAQGADIFLIGKDILQIDVTRATIELCKKDYLINGSCISNALGQRLVSFEVRRVQQQSRQGGTVHFRIIDGAPHMGRDVLLALRHIATCEMVKAWGSFFVSVDEIYLDGSPMVIPAE